MPQPQRSKITPKLRTRAVLRHLRGEELEPAAVELGVSQDDLERWEREFVRAGRRALSLPRYDEVDVPSLEALLTVAQRGFPYQVLRDAASAASLFAARFYGRNDTIHLYRAGVPDVAVVDIDGPRIEAMEAVYPERWDYIVDDVFEFAKRCEDSGRRFDVTICDCTTEMAVPVLTDLFPRFNAITSQYLLVYSNQDMFDTWGASATPESVGDALSRIHGHTITVADLPKRSSSRGGTYWTVVRAEEDQSG